MNKREKIKLSLLIFAMLACIGYLIWSGIYQKEQRKEALIELVNLMQSKVEQGYFEGQKDALSGDFRIGIDSTECWYWTESPWDSTEIGFRREPIFDPSNK